MAIVRASMAPVDRAMRSMAPHLLSPEALSRRPEIVEQWIAIARTERRRRLGLAGQLLAAGGHDAWSDLSRITAPTLVMTGDADRLIPAENSHRIASRISGARLHPLAGAGHDFPAERPEETASAIRAFLLS